MSGVSYGGINPGEVARQSQQLWQSLRGVLGAAAQGCFLPCSVDVCADLHKHLNLLTRLPRAPCLPASLGPTSLQAACT